MGGEIVAAAAWAILLGGAGGLLTDIGPWYRNLQKPRWQPPDWLFGPAWTLILVLAAWAAVLAWQGADVAGQRRIMTVYAVNFVFHILWSPLFFLRRRPDRALVEVVFLWISLVAMIVVVRQFSPLAGWLVLPYLLWVSFATVLNWKIVVLNRPFGRP